MRKFILCLILGFAFFNYAKADFLDFASLILGRPTNNSITINVTAKNTIDFYIEYGTAPNSYTMKTATYQSAFPEPTEFTINDLSPDTYYYYIINYRSNSSESYQKSKEYYFHTQRAKGKSFKFTIQADPHLYDKKGSDGLMRVSMDNQAKDSADFIIDMGDTFGDDHQPFDITEQQVYKLHTDYLPFFGMLCHSSPLFLCIGNHEGESGYYLLQTPPNNLATYATKSRQKYYPNPYPDNFYSGNTDVEEFGIGMPENYYSFTWGDALIVVLDVYRYYTANEKPKKWDWTIGSKQYFWFKNVLETSNAKYKFVFAHHILGQGRGAKNDAVLYEWGGYEDPAKTKWGFTTNRPGWDKPIHQLMVDNKVNIFFQGHDHLYAKEELDGLIYQEVPMPSDSTYKIGVTDNGDAYTDLIIDGSGYLRVNISDSSAKVDYIKSYLPQDENDTSKNYSLAYSYEVKNGTSNVVESSTNYEISIYPNPVIDELNIYMDNAFNNSSNIKIINQLGECVYSSVYNSNIMKLDLNYLTSGIYILKIGNTFKQFIKL